MCLFKLLDDKKKTKRKRETKKEDVSFSSCYFFYAVAEFVAACLAAKICLA